MWLDTLCRKQTVVCKRRYLKPKWKPSWATCKLMNTNWRNTHSYQDQNSQGTNHQSDHAMSSGLLLLTVLQGILGLFKYVFLFQSLQLTHWDKLHHSTENPQVPEGLCRTASSHLGWFLLCCTKRRNLKGGKWRRAGHFTVTSHDQQRWYWRRNTRLITHVVKVSCVSVFLFLLSPVC